MGINTTIRSLWEKLCQKQDKPGVIPWYTGLPCDEVLPPYVKQLLHDRADHLTYPRQYDISLTKFLHGFNVTDVCKDFVYMKGEVDEVAAALDEGDNAHIAEELADVAIYCYGMAQMLGYNLDEEIEKKMQYNAVRTYPTDLKEGTSHE